MPLPAVIYAAKSTPDDRDSLSSQLDACRKATADRTVVGEFSEENASGYKANRGPQLEAAIKAAKAAAPAELWVWHTSRLGRGTGLLGEARALGALLYDLRAAGVTVRSVEDDGMASNEAMFGMASSMASQYSENLSRFVKKGKERQRERGEVLGGPCPDGYHQPVKPGPRLIDPSRSPLIVRMYELALNHGDAQVARKLNEEGYRRKSGAAWERRTVQAIVTNPHYGGQWKNTNGTPIDSIVSPEDWQAVQDARAVRDHAAGGRKAAADRGGRPTTQFVLAKLGICGRCGGRMYAQKGVYTRKDGTKQRDYVCRSVHFQDGLCSQPRVSAGPVDLAIVARLRDYFADFDGFVRSYAADHESQRASLDRRLALAEEEETTATRRATRAEEMYDKALDAEDDDRAEAALGALTSAKKKAKAAAATAEALRGEIAEHGDGDTAAHEALTWWRSLASAVRDGLDSGSIGEVNGHLQEVLDEVVMDSRDDGSVHLSVIFKRGSFEPGTELVGWDEDGDPIEAPSADVPGFWVPDSVDVYVPATDRKQGQRITA